jgi:hypothetical protein
MKIDMVEKVKIKAANAPNVNPPNKKAITPCPDRVDMILLKP